MIAQRCRLHLRPDRPRDRAATAALLLPPTTIRTPTPVGAIPTSDPRSFSFPDLDITAAGGDTIAGAAGNLAFHFARVRGAERCFAPLALERLLGDAKTRTDSQRPARCESSGVPAGSARAFAGATPREHRSSVRRPKTGTPIRS